jgi:hypothetical protein
MKTKLGILTVLLGAISIGMLGCTYTKVLTPPTALIADDSQSMDVLMKDGTIYKLDNAVVSIKDIVGRGYKYPLDGQREVFSGTLALDDISIVQTSKSNIMGSFLTDATIGVLAVAAIGALDGSGPTANANIIYPSSGGDGSCPFVFTNDGSGYRFESETFAGAICQGMELANLEPLKYLKPINGEYNLALANQLQESEHVNEISLLAIDHPSGTEIIPDCNGQIHTISNPMPPFSAISFSRDNVLELINKADNQFWGNLYQNSNSSFNNNNPLNGIICEFERPPESQTAKLVLNMKNSGLGYFGLEKIHSLEGPNRMNWIYKLNSDVNERNRLKAWMMREGGLHVSLLVDGEWISQGSVPLVGPKTEAEKIVLVDLSQCHENSIKIKIESTPDLWLIDAVAIDYSTDANISVSVPKLCNAVTQNGQNVAEMISNPDSLYYSMLPGDYALLSFGEVPQSKDMDRTFLLKSQGFYYPWIAPGENYDSTTVDRIINEPFFGTRLLMSEWSKSKSLYAEKNKCTPQFKIRKI